MGILSHSFISVRDGPNLTVWDLGEVGLGEMRKYYVVAALHSGRGRFNENCRCQLDMIEHTYDPQTQETEVAGQF